MKTINISLIVLISINLFISLITTANRAGNTAQYKDSLQILKELEEGHYSRYENDYDYDNYYNENDYDYDNYYDENKYYPRDYYNHDINNVSLFKSWKNVELVLNLLRFILLLFQFVIIFYLLSKRLKNLDLPEKSLPRAIILSIGSMILSIIQLIYSIIIAILILLTMNTIEEIESYSDDTSSDFNTRSYFNIFLNITIIVLFSICISFSYRIYYNGIYNKGKRLCGIKNKSAKFKSITK
jgi:ABC-type multidrug transport system permease subunit